MAKIYSITVALVGLIFLLNVAGITTFSGSIYNYIIGDGQDISNSPLYALIIGSIFLTVAGAIIAGFYLRQSSESFLVTPIASALFLITAADILSIANIQTGEAWMDTIIKFIMYPLLAGYCIAIIQWWRGNDIL